MTQPSSFTLIIPAHNEEAVIERCLAKALNGAPGNPPMQIIVAANGCTDRTVEIARAAAPDALVLDLPQGGKAAALNAANERAEHFPRIYLDADVQCDYASLRALARALHQPGVMAASPQIRMDLSRSSFLVAAYYRVWLTQPYVTRNLVGSGCYGLSQAGYEAVGDFPLITGDDIWVHSRFTESQRRSVREDESGNPVCFVVSPPLRAIDQIRIDTRRRLGNEELLRLHPSPHFHGSNSAGDLPKALSNGASLIDVAIYLGFKLLTRLRAAWAKRVNRGIAWERDLTARGT